MLENGDYRENREVSYYADALCVTPKYLSEVSKAVSGYTANYWINRYTSLDIARLLRDKTLTFVEISDMFHFSSPASTRSARTKVKAWRLSVFQQRYG